VYLTQVRSVLLMTIVAVGVLTVLTTRRGALHHTVWVVTAGAALVIGSFYWASSVGGESVENRFIGIREQGAISLYQQNRGHFLAYTTGELLDKFPLGAGVGRWGMMNAYFGDKSDESSAPLYAEIQLTGWLLDGGIPMWLLYGGGILMTLFVSAKRAGTRDPIADVGLTVLVFVAGMATTGPVFNTQVGMFFWTLAAALPGSTKPVVTPATNNGKRQS
jgi:hypothetical protein